VGGDYFDYFARGNGVVDIVIADVTGHSIGAALMAAEVRTVLHAEVPFYTLTSDIMREISAVLYDDLNQAGLYLTLAYVKYDTVSRLLTCSSAGHPPLLLSGSAESSCRLLDPDGLILGVRKEVAFEEKRVQLESGDVVFLYTDGIVEAQTKDGEMFGVERLCRILRTSRGRHPKELVEAVRCGLAEFTGGAAVEDDVTMVAMAVQ
jgi:sigma-B regulation protein RsbU (phosphoserine phosphatase)